MLTLVPAKFSWLAEFRQTASAEASERGRESFSGQNTANGGREPTGFPQVLRADAAGTGGLTPTVRLSRKICLKTTPDPACAPENCLDLLYWSLMSSASARHDDAIEQTWRAVEQLADELLVLSRQPLPPAEFHAALLQRALAALAASAGAFWTRDARGFRLECQVQLAGTPREQEVLQPGHLNLLDAAWQATAPQLALPRAGGAAPDGPVNPTDQLLLLGPVRVEEQTVGLVELLQRPTTHPQVQQAYLNLLAAMCEAAADFHRNQELRRLRDERAFWEQAELFSQRTHGAAGLSALAYAVVNEGRGLLGTDRVSLAVRRGGRCVMLAVSGVERLERRSPTIRGLERLAALAAAAGEPLHYAGGTADLSPQVERVLQPYLDAAHVRELTAVPLRAAAGSAAAEAAESVRPVVGVLISERFDARQDAAFPQRLDVVCRHSGLALQQALRSRHLLRRGWDWFFQAGPLLKTAAVGLLLVLLIGAAVLVPADFNIQARGELLPRAAAGRVCPGGRGGSPAGGRTRRTGPGRPTAVGTAEPAAGSAARAADRRTADDPAEAVGRAVRAGPRQFAVGRRPAADGQLVGDGKRAGEAIGEPGPATAGVAGAAGAAARGQPLDRPRADLGRAAAAGSPPGVPAARCC